jgi:hypothetical protein
MNKNEHERVFIDSDGEQQLQKENAEERPQATRATNLRARKAAAAPTPEPPPESKTSTRRATNAAKDTPTDEAGQPAGGSANKKKGGKGGTASQDLLPSYRSAAAVARTSTPNIVYGAGKVAELKAAGANVPFDVPRPAVSANVRGVPTHDDNVAALIKFWPHGDAVVALAQTMAEEGGEDLNRAHDFLMRKRDERIAAAVQREKDEAPGKGSRDDDEEEEAIREGGELAVFVHLSQAPRTP